MFGKIKEKIKRKRMPDEGIEGEELKVYLHAFRCSSCHNHCSLDQIHCGGGLKQREEKVKEFEAKSSLN
ncbi:hypothetical protein [Tannockella kyphosi]|uniref:hypothetical protein n=1 Tax=Tannockella kyphosi TaxID=2899121 RepID=UPI002013542F|nr:hypothetical protein [Tannockella kyphosi]